MSNLPNTAPEVHKVFEARNFPVHQTSGPFDGVWTDLAITQSETAREKYIKTLPFMMAVSESMQWMVHMQSPDSDHHEKLAMDDMPKVLKIIDTVMECMRNPFVPTVAAEKLVNIAKGEIFTSSDVVDSKQLGLDVIAHARSTDAEKIISPKILTFAGQQKQTKKRQDSVKQIVSEEGTVTRALCFTRELTEEDKAGYKMRKGNKADFLDTLQNKVSDTWKPLEELPPSALTPVYVIDAMTSVQRFQTLGDSKFNQLQERYKDKIMKMKPMKPKMKPSVPSVMSIYSNELSVNLTFHQEKKIQLTTFQEFSKEKEKNAVRKACSHTINLTAGVSLSV
ncbi:hypothetical protein GQR58_021448 [Nymphon striatum]|nr:hypothetical protein GQR58_021448 [Nymphon striatum]